MLGWQTRGKKSKYTFEGISENLVDVFDRVHLCDSCKRVERIVFACSPYKILRHVSPSTTESSANVTSPLPAASVWLRLWPFCTVNLKFQGRFEQLVFIAGVKTFRQVKFPPSLVVSRFRSSDFYFLATTLEGNFLEFLRMFACLRFTNLVKFAN